jgi:membrane associated rhomboid family serine protease
MSWLLFLGVLVGIALYMASAAEREHFIQIGREFIRNLVSRTGRRATGCEPFFDALRTRTALVVITPALAALNIAVFLRMLIGSGSFSDPATLVAWGANFGPLTTSGEWWRLVAMMFVHVGPLHLAATLAGLVPAGIILERLVGRVAFFTTYLGTGLVAALISLTTAPIAMNVGPSGAIFGIYGLLSATVVWGVIDRSAFTIPLAVLKDLAPTAALFFLYNLLTDRVDGTAEAAAFVAGCIGGIAVVLRLDEEKPAPRKLAMMAASVAVFTLVFAVSLPAIADVRPELTRTLDIERRSAEVYSKQIERFKTGRTTTDALAHFIEKNILPDLRTQRERFKALEGVPPQHRAVVADAQSYLQLRIESWQLRADALRKSNYAALRHAETVERQALDEYAKLSPP